MIYPWTSTRPRTSGESATPAKKKARRENIDYKYHASDQKLTVIFAAELFSGETSKQITLQKPTGSASQLWLSFVQEYIGTIRKDWQTPEDASNWYTEVSKDFHQFDRLFRNAWLSNRSEFEVLSDFEVEKYVDGGKGEKEVITSVVIPEGVQKIAKRRLCFTEWEREPDWEGHIFPFYRIGVFEKCRQLTSVILPDTLISIADATFMDCAALESLVFPKRVINIGAHACSGCSGLTFVTFPRSLTTVGDMAFRGCCRLTSLALPDKLTNVGQFVFKDCTSLSSVHFRARRPSRAVFIVWAVSNSRNRDNWQVTGLDKLRNILAIITIFTLYRRDVCGLLHADRPSYIFDGCENVVFTWPAHHDEFRKDTFLCDIEHALHMKYYPWE